MSWRCGAHGGAQRCMLAPGHQGAHRSVLLADGQVGLVTWLSPEVTWLEPSGGMATPESGAGLARDAAPAQSPEGLAPVVVPEPPLVHDQPHIIREPWSKGYHEGREGRVRKRAWTHNLYAALDEGIHTNWDLFGHEVLPLPSLDEIEAALA